MAAIATGENAKVSKETSEPEKGTEEPEAAAAAGPGASITEAAAAAAAAAAAGAAADASLSVSGSSSANVEDESEWVPPVERLVCPADVLSLSPGISSVYWVGTSGQKITILSGLAEFHETLEELCLRSNLIRSLAGIETLSKLLTLELADNQIRELGPMNLGSTCPRLTNLDISYNQIRRIENIRGLTCLKHLYIANNKLTSIGMEEGMGSLPASLKRLDLGANRIRRIENVPPSLEELWLGKNKITEIGGLEAMDGSLKILDVQCNRLTGLQRPCDASENGKGAAGKDISARPGDQQVDGKSSSKKDVPVRVEQRDFPGLELECLGGLEELYLSHNGIEKMEGLAHLTSLNTLDLSNNRISLLEGMTQLKSLEEFWMNDNQISDFECVAAQLKPLPKLKTVYLERNPVSKEFGYRKQLASMLPTLVQIDASKIPGRR